MNASERNLCCGRTDERTKHVTLRIPQIALGSEKRVRTASFNQRHSPFKQLITRADCYANAHHHENAPPWAGYDAAPDQYFSRNNGGDKALGEVAELVIVISLQMKVIAHPVEKRNLSIRVVTADQQNACMHRDQQICQIGESKPSIGGREYHNRDQGRERFQPPCPAVKGSHPRPHQYHANTDQKAKRPDKLASP